MDTKAKINSTDVGKRINETKREIAQLNEELEKLINTNFNKHNSSGNDQETTNLGKVEKISTIVKRHDTSTKTPNMGSNVTLKYSKRTNIAPINFSTNLDNRETLCKKNKSYDKESAKAYIKQQREKREEERKKLCSKSKIDQEIRKQKLSELQQKSLALVHRNIQLSRERSKSREKGSPIRIDKSICSNKTTKLQSKKSSPHEPYTQTVNYAPKFKFQNHEKSKDIQISPERRKFNMHTALVHKSKQLSNEYIENPNLKMGQSSSSLEIKSQNYAPPKNITCRADSIGCLSNADQDLAATKIQAYYRGYRIRKNLKNIKLQPNHVVEVEKNAKESKETQTNVQEPQIVTPLWLQPPSIDPYPCNFINTVKRKLQFVVNSVNSRDMGTQSSIVASCSHAPVESYNKYEDNHLMNVKSRIEDRLNSFHSHRYSNLDADALQHMVLVHNENKGKKTKHNINGYTESESDTSKNITDIISEVVLTQNPNNQHVSVSHEHSNNLIINTDKIRNLHLTDASDRNKANSHTFTKVLQDSVDIDQSISKKSYTFNFYDEENTDNTDNEADKGKYIKSPRDSILSFNLSDYRSESNNKTTTDSSLLSNQSGQILNEISRPSARRRIISDNICSDMHPSNSNIIENIENSINTSLVSHISDKSDSSLECSSRSKKTATLKSENSVSIKPLKPANVLFEPSISQITLANHLHLEDKNEYVKSIQNSSNMLTPINFYHNSIVNKSIILEKKQAAPDPSDVKNSKTSNSKHVSSSLSNKSSKHSKMSEKSSISTEYFNSIQNSSNMLTPINSSHNSIVNKPINLEKKQAAPEPSDVKNSKTSNSKHVSTSLSNKSSKHSRMSVKSSISTEYSDLAVGEEQFSQQENLQSRSEVTDAYSENFCSEQTDSLKKNEGPFEENETAQFKENPKNESHSEVNMEPRSDIINNLNNKKENDNHIVKNINSKICRAKGDSNEIHLKFEAEVHLLNDFSESLNHFRAVEKAFETIKSKNGGSCMKVQSRKSSAPDGPSFSENSNLSVNLNKRALSSVNLSRGSEFDDSHLSNETLMRTAWRSLNNSQNLEISNIDENIERSSITVRENIPNNLAGLSIKMFEQLIKDEDVRIENLKTILKIREQALLDRTKGELAWLEIQRKHLKETGQLHEASLVKKKQRGILLKHQQERQEMQRLKQLQKMQSNERKTILKEQRNLIKAKLTSEKVMSEMKIHTPRKRRSSGPMKVLKTSGSIHSETSITKKTSDWEEILSVTSRSQSVRLSEADSTRDLIVNTDETNIRMVRNQNNLSDMKRALLMRQTALMERRKAVEDLLYRHQKLLEEEKKIEELEMAANAIILQMPTINHTKSVDGNKLKLIEKLSKENTHKTDLLSEKNSVDKSVYVSQPSQNKLHDETINKLLKCDNNTQLQETTAKNSSDTISTYNEIQVTDNTKSEQRSDSVSKKSFEYSEDFELNTGDTVNDVSLPADANETNLCSISELIQDFSEIEHGISMLSKQLEPTLCSVSSHNSHSDTESVNDFEPSVIETNTMQNVDNTDKDNFHIPLKSMETDDIGPSIDTSQKFYSLLEASENKNSSEAEKAVSSISTIAVSLASTEGDANNSSKIISNKFFEDVTSATEIQSQPSKSDNTSKHSTSNSSEDCVRNLKNASNKRQFGNYISHDKTSSIESVALEAEDEIASENLVNSSIHGVSGKDETVHKSSTIETLTEDSIKPEYSEQTVKEETDKVSNLMSNSYIEEMHNVLNLSENDLISETKIIVNHIDSESNEIISERIDVISLEETDTQPHIEENSVKLEQFNSDLEDEEASNKINSIYENSPSISPQEQQNDIDKISDLQVDNLMSLDENISSKQTIDEGIPDLSNSHLCKTDKKSTISITKDSFTREKKSNLNITAENNSDEIGFGKLFENELCKTSSTTTDISEKLSTDSEHIDISELSPSDNSDNYTDDFEDDKEGDSFSQKHLKNDCSTNSSQSDASEIKSKDNEVLMMKIDLVQAELSNQANIVVMLGNKLNSQEEVSNNDKNCVIEDVRNPIEEVSGITESEDKSEANDSSPLRTVKSGEHLEIVKPEVCPVSEKDQFAEVLSNTVNSPKSVFSYRDYHTTTYEDITPVNSPESVTPVKSSSLTSMNIFGSEAEELLKKQIAIEQEIKHLEQQQKEHLPFVYMREIPNKPPPPYTPPSSISHQTSTILPSKVEDVTEICNYSAKVLYNAYLSNKLNDVTFSEIDFKSINQTKSTKECCLFVFDLCREVVKNHYKKFEKDNVPYWLKASRESQVMLGKPFDYYQLEKHINSEVKHLLGFEKKYIRENSVIRWSKKKKDHVDEILALESQFEENEWLDYEKDELMVKNEITNEIFNVLLKETIDIYKNIFS